MDIHFHIRPRICRCKKRTPGVSIESLDEVIARDNRHIVAPFSPELRDVLLGQSDPRPRVIRQALIRNRTNSIRWFGSERLLRN
jgi:hypothetical protein